MAIFFVICAIFCYLTRFAICDSQYSDITQHPNWKLIDNESCGQSSSDRIIGGKNASLGQYLWLARISYISPKWEKEQFRCGGSLINKWYVLTAAHCVTNLPPDLEVNTIRLGEYNADTDIDCDPIKNMCAEPVQDFTPSKIIVHKDYGSPKFKNDVALIRLNKEAVYNGWVDPICLPEGEILTKNYENQNAEVAGWGIYDMSTPAPSIILQTIKLPILALSRCVEAFRRHAPIGDQQMCVGGRVGEDSCGGDSGGPLMKVDALDGPPKYFVIGIVSFGAKQCGSTTMPAVYTKISTYINWILDHIEP